jgi:hypothetical protein
VAGCGVVDIATSAGPVADFRMRACLQESIGFTIHRLIACDAISETAISA